MSTFKEFLENQGAEYFEESTESAETESLDESAETEMLAEKRVPREYDGSQDMEAAFDKINEHLKGPMLRWSKDTSSKAERQVKMLIDDFETLWEILSDEDEF